MSQFNTLLLDPDAWDLTVDAAGNIATAAPSYSLAQDVASAVRLVAGELWYDIRKGVPYFSDILGHNPPLALIAAQMEDAALSVPGVVSARYIHGSRDSRTEAGQILFVDETGASNNVNI